MLESQKWHKLELYAKEIELECRIKGLEKLRQEAQYFSEIEARDKIKELGYYAFESDLEENDSEELLKINQEERPKNIIEYWQLWFYRHTSDHHTDLTRIISWVIAAIGMFGLISFGIKCYQDPSTFSRLNPYIAYASFVGTIMLELFCVTGYIKGFFVLAGTGLISTLWIACYKPSLIFGAVNLVDKAPRSVLENIVLVLYTLIMILLLFSLQKTARKNSIIPN